MGEAKRRKASGDYPVAIEEAPTVMQTPGRRVIVAGSGMSFGALAALLASREFNTREEAQ